jgi:hypothetical protein
MTEQTIAIYCFIDDFFISNGRKDDVHCKVSDAEILTTALLAARYFYGNLCSACAYRQHHQGVKIIDESGFSRRLHRLRPQLLALFLTLSDTLKQLNTAYRYLIDSCRNNVHPALSGNAQCRMNVVAARMPANEATSMVSKYKLSPRLMGCRCSSTFMPALLPTSRLYKPCPCTCRRIANFMRTVPTPAMNWKNNSGSVTS